MGHASSEFDCESILQMLRETPEAADAIVEMIRDLDGIDESCIEMIREMQRSRDIVA